MSNKRNKRSRNRNTNIGYALLQKGTPTPYPVHPAKLPVLGIDPGLRGTFVLFDGAEFLEVFMMPVARIGAEKRVDFHRVLSYLEEVKERFGVISVYLERAKPMAMGSKFAFNYGRDFEKVVLATLLAGFKSKMVEPAVWAKEMHEGISTDLKPKAKSLLAVQKLYPHLVERLPKRPKGKLDDGPIDGLLICGYAIRMMSQDFF